MTAVRMGADERRELVVRAALTEFARSGFAGTSTEAIAKRAGISQPYLFRLFATKKDLFIAVVDRASTGSTTPSSPRPTASYGEEALEAMGDAYGVLLQDRELLLAQMHAYAAATTPTSARPPARLPPAVAAGRAGDRPAASEEVVQFFAMGMLINVAATLDLPHLDEPWAQSLHRADLPGPAPDYHRRPSARFCRA